MVELFKTGYETADFSEFEDQYIAQGSSVIVSSPVHHGNYAHRAETTARFGAVMRIKYLSAGHQIIYVRSYAFFETLPGLDANMYPFYIRHRATNLQYAGIFARTGAGGGAPRWNLNYSDNGGTGRYAPQADTGPELGQWYCIEVMVKRGAGDGEIRVWIDGVETITVTGLNNDALDGQVTPDIDAVWVGLGEGPNTGTSILVNDCLVVADAHIGPELPIPEHALTVDSSVDSSPVPSVVSVDGVEIGTTPITGTFSEGIHQVHISEEVQV